ncbi:Uncharacterised protein [Yersinia pestis]|uniref:Uncharacterized protein n=1 Tax=Yersinia pestis TaxID=632 RepID=A0AAX2HZK0_YERPE|nr:Uncharacterised protein [Yersinia pestis]
MLLLNTIDNYHYYDFKGEKCFNVIFATDVPNSLEKRMSVASCAFGFAYRLYRIKAVY